ncbi:hypothetical protein H4CHR_02030 [Variovorax sp. PBS-H4]|uniref:hypothetical protein n=1 Tax=Variovorax sp. PBS-H4 TaxID=434008 RepID=UPI00131837A1|nr:hypothetical protein [Variovorax sp. PBS-H4]VTU27594.1 hypothetical protein H4CHR_02030 [Variovorax sp. PBS-H4]
MQATPILVERRFPLELKRSIVSIRELYEISKASRWTPAKDIAWDSFDPGASEAARNAARLVWSRRAWLEYTGLAETPALLIRFCLELDRESDPKYFLAVRNTEEAWHLECFHRYAKALGGYINAPSDKRWEAVLNRTLYRDALDATQSLDGYVAVHCAIEDGIELALYQLYAGNAREPVAAQILARAVAAKERHASFGWLYLQERAARMDDAAKAAIVSQIESWLTHVAFAGYQIPSLSTEIDAGDYEAAATLAAEAGLGAATPAQEQQTFRQCVQDARTRLAQWGFALPTVRHPVLGEV